MNAISLIMINIMDTTIYDFVNNIYKLLRYAILFKEIIKMHEARNDQLIYPAVLAVLYEKLFVKSFKSFDK